MRNSGSSAFVFVAALAACTGSGAIGSANNVAPQTAATCPPPSPGPTPIAAWLAYPPSGSTNVATSIGELIEKGAAPGNGLTMVVSSAAGNVPLGAPTIAPSPYPTPFATPPPTFGWSGPYVAVPLPALSPAATYTVTDVYTDWANNPPACSAQYTQPVGTFTTR